MPKTNETLTIISSDGVAIWPRSNTAAPYMAIPVIEGLYKGRKIELIDLAGFQPDVELARQLMEAAHDAYNITPSGHNIIARAYLLNVKVDSRTPEITDAYLAKSSQDFLKAVTYQIIAAFREANPNFSPDRNLKKTLTFISSQIAANPINRQDMIAHLDGQIPFDFLDQARRYREVLRRK